MKKIILLFLVFIIFLQAKELEHVSLRLKWKFQFQFAGFLIAKEKGFYEEEGIDIDIIEFSNDIELIDDVITGKTNFGISDSSLVYEALKGKPILAMMSIFQKSPFVLIGLKSSNINELKDINHKKIAMYRGIDGIAIQTMLKSNDITYISASPIFTINKLISKEVDMMTAYISNEPYIAKIKNIDIIIFSPKDYGFEAYGDILFTSQNLNSSNPQLVGKMYYASYRGWNYAFSHIDEVVDIIYRKYNTLNKTKEALLFEAHELKKISGYGKKFGKLDFEKIKGIAQQINIVKQENNKLNNLNKFIYKPNENINLDKRISTVFLSSKEKGYLANIKNVKVCYDKTFYPVIYTKNNQSCGVSSKMLSLISEKIDVNFTMIETDNWIEQLSYLENGLCDMVAVIIKTPNYYNFLTPSDTYIDDDLVLITAIDEPYIFDFNSLKNKKIGIKYGFKSLKKYLQERYPNMEFIEIKNTALDKVLDGTIFGFVTMSYGINEQIAKSYKYKLKIMEKIVEHKIEGSFGVSNREIILVEIINKALAKISIEEKNKIFSSFNSKNFNQVMDYRLIQQISIGFLLLVFIIILFLLNLKRNNMKLTRTINSTIEGIVIFKNGKLTDVNQVLLDMYGYESIKEVLGRSALDFVSKKDYAFIKKQILKTQEPYEVDMLRRDGTTFPSLVKGTQVSSLVRITGVIDLTELKNTYYKLENLNKRLEIEVKDEVEKNRQKDNQLQQQSKLAQMGEMIGAIAHQWRQPLNEISTGIQNLKYDYKEGLLEDEAYVKIFIDKNKKTIKFMSQTIDDFRNFFRVDKDKKEFDIKEATRAIISMQSAQLKEYNIKIILIGDSFVFYGLESEYQQVILNIINNAKDALVENKIKNPTIEVIVSEHSVTIRDNAGGIPTEIIERIFEPYFTTKEQGKGTGIGLYMSKMIIEKGMGGVLSVNNSSDGARFVINFEKGKTVK